MPVRISSILGTEELIAVRDKGGMIDDKNPNPISDAEDWIASDLRVMYMTALEAPDSTVK